MQQSVCSFQYRGGKDFPDRNIDVRHTVLKVGLLFRFRQLVQLNRKIRFVFPLPLTRAASP